MPTDDPFSSPGADDRTVIRPVPGGRQADLQPPSPSFTPTPRVSDGPLPLLGQLNPLEHAASGLLALITQLNNSRHHPDANTLRNKVIGEIKQFQTAAIASDIDQETVFAARYLLCTVLDEAVLNTPWGSNSGWSQQNLLSTFHKEVSGGERFFQLLKKFGQNTSKNINILELMYLCLALGFEGRYRIVNGGKDKLAQIREWLYQLIRKERSNENRELSPHWRGVTDKRSPLMRFVPTWVFGTAGVALLALLFAALLFHLNGLSDPVFKQVYAIKVPELKFIPPAPAPPIIVPEIPPLTLTQLLSEEIKQGVVKVDEDNRQGLGILQGDTLFPSGSIIVNKNAIRLLHRIGSSMNQLGGQILITGHTDDDPIKTIRYPSNWHLSLARAKSVEKILLEDVDDPARMMTEGRGDTEPVTSNETAQGKAKNRRVEILLIKL